MKKNACKLVALMLTLALAICLLPATAAHAAESQQGQFTVCSLNVDGLPTSILGFSINSDGPGSDGTKAMSAKIAEYGWDIIGVSEDFNYNTELLSSLSGYNSGTHRGSVSSLKNDTDGLNLIWKNSISVSGESWTAWTENYATGLFGTGNGADTMINKGFRFYQATVADGVTVDIYILHMDADSDARDIAAREAQIIQLADAIKASNNGNPIIVMGDTNCRYTRENLETLFIDVINADSRFTIQDAWIEKVREGKYPVYGSDAIVATDKGGTYDYPQAEIVDKIFYINNTESSVTLQADSYEVATGFVGDDGSALADHWPVVVQFTYSVAAAHVHNYTETSRSAATCTENGYVTYTCGSCGDSYTENIPAAGHSYAGVETKAASCTEEGVITYTCGTCGDSYTENIPAAGHSYAGVETKAASCTEEGVITYTCGSCGDIYTEVIPATGHNYVNNACQNCGDVITSGDGNWVLGEETCDITSGKQYVVVFCGSNGNFSMNTSGTSIVSIPYSLQQGDVVDKAYIWTIEELNDKYVFSTEVDGHTYYLYRTTTFSGSGYKIGLTTAESKATAWSVSRNNSLGTLRFSVKSGFSSYYLRYHNARIGWQASLSAAGIHLYEVEQN